MPRRDASLKDAVNEYAGRDGSVARQDDGGKIGRSRTEGRSSSRQTGRDKDITIRKEGGAMISAEGSPQRLRRPPALPGLHEAGAGYRIYNQIRSRAERERRRLHARGHLGGLGLRAHERRHQRLQSLFRDMPAQQERGYRQIHGRAVRHLRQFRRTCLADVRKGRLELVHRFGPVAPQGGRQLDTRDKGGQRLHRDRSVIPRMEGLQIHEEVQETCTNRVRNPKISAFSRNRNGRWEGRRSEGSYRNDGKTHKVVAILGKK